MGLKIAEDNNFNRLKELIDSEDLSTLIIDKLEEAEILIDEPESYGKSVGEIIEKHGISRTVASLYCLNSASEEIEEIFGNLYIVGTGNCPICGGDMEVDEDSTYIEAHGDNETPDDIGGEYECTNCGHRE